MSNSHDKKDIEDHWKKVRQGIYIQQIMESKIKWKHYQCLHIINNIPFKNALYSRKLFGKITEKHVDVIEQDMYYGRRK